MRIARTARLLATTAAAALVVGLAAAGPVQAVPVTTVDAVTFSSPSLTVSGLAMSAQTITAHIVDPGADPVVPAPNESDWLFELSGTGRAGSLRAMDVAPTLTSGTKADGVWSATVQVPSTADGSWTLAHVQSLCVGACLPPVVPSVSPSFTVFGTHQPRLSLGVVPSAVHWPTVRGVVKGRVIDADTGLGMAGVPVGYSLDTACTNDQGDGGYGPAAFIVLKTTNASGYYSFSPADLRGLQCVGIWGSVRRNSDGYSAFPVFRTFSVRIKPVISATAASRTAKVGTGVVVRGTWAGESGYVGPTVLVQQLHGRTAWRTVATAIVSSLWTWKVTVKPTARGANVFRALAPTQPGYVASGSHAFTITGT